MRRRCLLLAVVLNAGVAALHGQAPGDCGAPAPCRQQAVEAIAAGDFERAHDLAWRVVQTSPRRDRDPAALSLLARAQSLSGRGYDALVILQRLADMGVIVDDADTSDDFRRVREHAQWPALLIAMTAVRERKAGVEATPPASEGSLLVPGSRRGARLPRFAVPVKPRSTASPGRDVPTSGGATPAAGSPAAVTAAAAPAAARTTLAPALALPAALLAPAALAYDAVSARFLVADGTSDAIQVVSETSGNATALVTAGWAGGGIVSALVIDRRDGTLWVAARAGERAVLHRLQLISGRLIASTELPGDAGPVRPAAVTVGAGTVYLLDVAGRRIFSIGAAGARPRVFAEFPAIEPIGLAHAGDALYVSHQAGIVRIEIDSRAIRPVTAGAGVALDRVHSLGWRNATLVGVRQADGANTAVRIHLAANGTRATALETIEEAGTTAAALAGDLFCHVTRRAGDAGLACHTVR